MCQDPPMIAVPKPLAWFGRSVGQDPESIAAYRTALLPLVGTLAADPASVAAYLRAGSIVCPFMGCLPDVLDGRHEDLREPRHRGDRRQRRKTAFLGGVALQSDGAYYWRMEAADYVEHYRIGLPDEFIEQMRSLDWKPPILSEEQARTIEEALLSDWA
jgi:hypothetical protein